MLNQLLPKKRVETVRRTFSGGCLLPNKKGRLMDRNKRLQLNGCSRRENQRAVYSPKTVLAVWALSACGRVPDSFAVRWIGLLSLPKNRHGYQVQNHLPWHNHFYAIDLWDFTISPVVVRARNWGIDRDMDRVGAQKRV